MSTISETREIPKTFRTLSTRVSRALCVCILSLAIVLPAAAGVSAQFPIIDGLYEDAKLVLITGRAVGQSGEPSKLSIHVNGIDFTITAYPVYREQAGQSAYEICQEFQGQIRSFNLGGHLTPEFDVFCLPVAGEAALLLVQASLSEYPPPTPNDHDTGKWIKAKSRILYVKVRSTDDVQRLYVK